jgi:hypothetical protein
VPDSSGLKWNDNDWRRNYFVLNSSPSFHSNIIPGEGERVAHTTQPRDGRKKKKETPIPGEGEP